MFIGGLIIWKKISPGMKLRGLPFDCQARDIVDFLGAHELGISEMDVQMENGRKGTFIGIAYVKIPGHHDLIHVCDKHNKRTMGTRWIEVFPSNSEEARKGGGKGKGKW